MEDARCALGESNRRIDSHDEAVDMQFGIRSGRFPVNRYDILPKAVSRRVRRGRSKRQKKLAEIAVQRTVLAAAALLMAGGKAKNDDDTDNNAEADGRHSGPPSGDAYAVGVRRGRSNRHTRNGIRNDDNKDNNNAEADAQQPAQRCRDACTCGGRRRRSKRQIRNDEIADQRNERRMLEAAVQTSGDSYTDGKLRITCFDESIFSHYSDEEIKVLLIACTDGSRPHSSDGPRPPGDGPRPPGHCWPAPGPEGSAGKVCTALCS